MSERTEQRGDGELGTCHMCGRVFDTQQLLADHLREEHEGDTLGDAAG